MAIGVPEPTHVRRSAINREKVGEGLRVTVEKTCIPYPSQVWPWTMIEDVTKERW